MARYSNPLLQSTIPGIPDKTGCVELNYAAKNINVGQGDVVRNERQFFKKARLILTCKLTR